ncbi:hypothetical protein [Methylobacterium sp. WSM2598]|uniref:hypothetical protein n=1 Tax=Methylobacterium sp. WSM2598 TaxID=398261 RepID=UPI000364AEBD|nr:hypothetical protein [Methylobacterium sp. WSM2598]
MSSDDPTDKALARAAKRAGTGPAPFVAALVEAWRKAFPDEDPAVALGCAPRAVTDLSLCLRPREERWFDDAAEIAGFVGIDLDHLVCFLRAAEAIEGMGDAHSADDAVEGRLLAARDRDEKDE